MKPNSALTSRLCLAHGNGYNLLVEESSAFLGLGQRQGTLEET